MRPPAAAAVLVALVALCGSACVGYGHAVEETRAGLIGLTGRDLRACMGPPDDFLVDGDLETITYHWFTGQQRTISMGNKGPVIIGSERPEPYDERGRPRRPEELPYCEIHFELVKGRVATVSSQGRSVEGLNADGKCLMRARPCLYEDEGYVEE